MRTDTQSTFGGKKPNQIASGRTCVRFLMLAMWATVAVLFDASHIASAQSTRTNFWQANSLFGGNSNAQAVISAIYSTAVPSNTVPILTNQPNSLPGTYWSLQQGDDLPPLPFSPFLDIPYYELDTTNGWYVYDDRGVDYEAVQAMAAMSAESSGATNPVFTGCTTCAYDESGLLWIEVPTNSLGTSGYFNVNLHNTVQNQSYDILTVLDLADTWTTELVVTGAVGNVTPLELPLNDRTNLLVRARTSTLHSFYLVTPPLSQSVLEGDMVTFYVETGGNTNLTFQWTLDGNAILGATNSSYTVFVVRGSDAGQYACIISDGTTSITTANAQLDVGTGTGDPNYMEVLSARQNYTFKSGVTYYLGNQIPFYGTTTIEAGAVIKPDWYYNAGLVIMGTLNCKGEPYYPAVITSVDDELVGKSLGFSADDGPPQPYQTGVPYLELACNKSNSISNLRIAYADWGVTTPTALKRLELWDCQFLQCNYGIVNLVAGDSTNSLHNVLFAGCTAALGASTNAITVEAEQVTADVTNFCLAYTLPARMDLRNSFIWGSAPDASSLSSLHVVLNPDPTNFATAGAGKYYLASNSPHHQSGASSISSRLQSELKNKTTSGPLALPAFMSVSGQITLSPQAQRYTNGAPDIGYHYDALDYTVAHLTLKGGTLDVLPGTAVGFRFDSLAQTVVNPRGYTLDVTYIGMDIWENSSLNVRGMPDRQCVFTDVQQVQEQTVVPVVAGIIPDYWPQDDGDQPPSMNFRFTKFYMGYAYYVGAPQYHIWSGISHQGYEWSWDSAMNFTLKDSTLRGGQMDIGLPDNPGYLGLLDYDTPLGFGAVAWDNNTFDGVCVSLNPTYYWYNGAMNCDLQVTANNNLFKNAGWFVVAPIPATAGNWAFRDNLFDKVQFYQDATLPLDFDHNGYWKLAAPEILFSGYTNRLLATATSSGTTEVFLTNAPPYQAGVFGNYYLSATTPLYQAGSRTAADAGLTQYTTFINQAKDAAGQPVNIGLHYVAATNTLPQDSDSDGIPDFVEVEHGTAINNAITDGLTNDIYNAVYDDTDLSGNGLVGRIKKALGQSPLAANNPLTLKRFTTGNEPDFATFEVPVSYDAVTNSGALSLHMNGAPVTLEECARGTNGNCLLTFNVAYDPMGQHFLSSEFRLTSDPNTANPVMFNSGGLTPFYSSNTVQFFEAGSMFDDSGAYLDAKLFEANADYRIELYDPSTAPATLLRTITNSTGNGLIQEDWDLMLSDGVTPFTNETVQAVFNVVYASNPSSSARRPSKILTRANGSLSEWGPNINVAYFRTSTNNAWETPFGKGGQVWNAMQGIVDVLIKPVWDYDVYQSYFNRFTPPVGGEYPGYITRRTRTTNDPPTLPSVVENLLPDLTNGVTKQIYIYGHGDNGWMGNYDASTFIEASDVRSRLKNTYSLTNLIVNNPYRFVFLDGCATASGPDWRRAFGIYPIDINSQGQAQRNKTGPQAYVGWAEVTSSMMNYDTPTPGNVTVAKAYARTVQTFYVNWMAGLTLKECIGRASRRTRNLIPFPVPANASYTVTLDGDPYGFANIKTSKIYVIGYPGLKVNGVDTSLNTDRTYAAPQNIE